MKIVIIQRGIFLIIYSYLKYYFKNLFYKKMPQKPFQEGCRIV